MKSVVALLAGLLAAGGAVAAIALCLPTTIFMLDGPPRSSSAETLDIALFLAVQAAIAAVGAIPGLLLGLASIFMRDSGPRATA